MSASQSLTLNGSSLTINGSTSGSDTFEFSSKFASTYVLNNFVGTGKSQDTIHLDKSLLSGASAKTWLANNVVASGNDVVIHDASNTITVTHAKLTDVLHDIIFV